MPKPAVLHWRLLFFVALLHAGAILLLATQPVRATVARTSAIMVALIPQALPPTPVPAIPVPRPHPLQIDVPAAPAIAIESATRLTAAAPAAQAPALADSPPDPQVEQPAPALEPPRFDMAYLNNPSPTYPALSKRLREQGRVLLRVRVSAAGNAELVEIHTSSGARRLDDAAIEAVRRWRFTPARLGAAAVPGWALVPIEFHLA